MRIGPKATAAWQADPGSAAAVRLRRMASWFGRLNLLLSLLLALVVFPVVRLLPGTREEREIRSQRWVHRACRVLLGTLQLLGVMRLRTQENWGSAFLMAATVYYFVISLSIAIGMLPFVLGLAALHLWLASSAYPALGVSVGLFVAGTTGLWLGRRGGPPHGGV